MSISSKMILPRADGYLRVELDADLVFCGDEEFEFIVSFFRGLREWRKRRDDLEAKEGENLGAK